jgi:carotenoid cleavage dioxygenase-like enzyme
MSSAEGTRAAATLGFADRPAEPSPRRELQVEGTLPPWLTGSLLRNGPGDWSVGGDRLAHWFDGFAQLHHFDFADGRVHYASRFLQTASRTTAERTGRLRASEFATDPCRSIFQRIHTLFDPSVALTDNANVSVQRLGDRLVAMTETPMPIIFDPGTLASTGTAYEAPGQLTTAHPHYERGTGALLNYAAHLGLRSSYRMYRVDPQSAEVSELARVPVRRPSYMHSFAITERFFVLAEFPLVVEPLRLALSNEPFIASYRWEPERGTRFTVVDRRSGRTHSRIQGEACFAFHHINAYEDGDVLNIDLCAASDASVIDDLYLDRIEGRLAAGRPAVGNYARPTRFAVDLRRCEARRSLLSDVHFELPVVNAARVRERPYTTTWGVGTGENWMDRIHAVDVTTGAVRTWAEDDTYPGEPVFVSRPGATDEQAGVLLSVVLDGRRRTSALVVLDARTLETLGRAEVGHPIPYGFHGLHTTSRAAHREAAS